MSEGAPSSFICPLTHDVMRDPVVDPEGNSYERSAIEEWLARNSTSPVTRSFLTVTDLVPNRALRELIETSPFAPAASTTSGPGNAGAGAGAAAVPASQLQLAATHVDLSVRVRSVRAVDLSGASPSASQLADGESEVVTVVSLEALGVAARTPLDVCCVVDISGSMGTEAVLQNASGAQEGHGLSLLDIVKHAVRTVAKVLGESDRLSLVVFDTRARRVFGLTKMDAAGTLMMEREVAKLQPEDTTNLWDGLRIGMDTLAENADPSRMSAILLLTDGMPNVVPPRGHLPMLQRYASQHEGKIPIISCFGFGYALDSPLLRELSAEGLGAYSFIPDSGMVGTAFVHALSQLLSTAARSVSFKLTLGDGVRLLNHPSRREVSDSGSSPLTVGSVQFEQSRDIVLRFAVPDRLVGSASELAQLVVSWNAPAPSAAAQSVTCSIENHSVASAVDDIGFVDSHALRVSFIDAVLAAIKSAVSAHKGPALGSFGFSRGSTDDPDALLAGLASAQALLKPVEDAVAAHVDKYNTPAMSQLLKDIRGQVAEALSRADWFLRWGIHYLPSLTEAHVLQQANNFKDASVQHYGGQLFGAIRDIADDAFCSLPPPKPSRRPTSARAPAPVASMRSYHDSGAPCFDGSCLVTMADGSQKLVRDVRLGDRVAAATCVGGGSAVVKLVVQTRCARGQQTLVKLDSGLLVTPFHPVYVNGMWQFPIDVFRDQARMNGTLHELPSDNLALLDSLIHLCPAVFSFVLDAGADSRSGSADALIINGIPCVSLGHSIADDPVASHPFFGSRSAVEAALCHLPGYESGHVMLDSGCTVRSETTGLVNGFSGATRAPFALAAAQLPSSLNV